MTTDSPKPSRAARWSLIIGILAWSVWCVYFIIFAAMIEGGTDFGSGLDAQALGYIVIFGGGLAASVISVLIAIIGLIAGIRALRNKDPQRGMAIAGLLLTIVCILPYLCIILSLPFSGLFSGGN